jgi:vitamin-K-epoxide reductase (warfarin-sensitive)
MRTPVTPVARKLFLLIAVLALAGIVVSSVALHNHYAKSKSSYCDFGESFNCDVVNRSQYSVIVGIPVALIGILGYAALLGLSTLYRDSEETPTLLLAAAAPGLAFALYLTYVEGFILSAWCILCLSSLVFISAITLLSAVLLIHDRRDS